MIKYIILGIIQGLTESLPLDTQSHIYLLKNLLNTKAFNNPILNIGILLAIIIIFRKEITKLTKAFCLYFIKKDNKKYQTKFKETILIFICAIFITIAKIFFLNKFEITSTKNIIINFIINAILLFFIKKNKNSINKPLTYKKALLIGLLELTSLIPGISQITITLFLMYIFKQNTKTSFRYTFLIYLLSNIIPITLNISHLSLTTYDSINYCIGILTNTIISYFTILYLEDLLHKNKVWKLSIYCILIALFTTIWFR